MTANMVTGRILDGNLARQDPLLRILLTQGSRLFFLTESTRLKVTSHMLSPHSLNACLQPSKPLALQSSHPVLPSGALKNGSAYGVAFFRRSRIRKEVQQSPLRQRVLGKMLVWVGLVGLRRWPL